MNSDAKGQLGQAAVIKVFVADGAQHPLDAYLQIALLGVALGLLWAGFYRLVSGHV